MALPAITLTKAAGSITSTKNFAADDSVTIGNRTYIFKASPSAAGDVDLGATEAISIANLTAAINGSGTEGTTYGTDTLPVAGVIATNNGSHVITLTARMAGAEGNNYALIEGTDSGTAFSVSAFANGEGDLSGTDGWLESLLDLNQINAEVIAALKLLTEAAD